MTEKVYTSKEINEKTNKYFMQYMEIFKNDKMSFAEFTLMKSVVSEIQFLFDEKNNGDVE